MAKSLDNIVELAESKPDPDWFGDVPQDGSFLDVAKAKHGKIKEVEVTSAATAKAIFEDVKLTDIGKVEKLRERGAGVLAQHKALSKEIDEAFPPLIAKAKAKEAKNEVSEIGQLMAMLREQEIRRDLAAEVGGDNLALEAKLSEASANGDAILLSALLSAPASSPLKFDRAKVTAMHDALTGGGMTLINTAQADVVARLAWAEQGIREDFGLGEADNLSAIANADVADGTA